jgi:glycosyltransferase involved in cell wall biosynthesis
MHSLFQLDYLANGFYLSAKSTGKQAAALTPICETFVPKKIYMEPAWKSPLSVNYLLTNPPNGYTFVSSIASNNLMKQTSNYNTSYKLLQAIGDAIPLQLVNSYIRRLKPPPKQTVLTYSMHHLIFRRERWLLDMTTELPFMLAWSEKHLERNIEVIRRALCSDLCKKIVCQVNKGKEAFLATFGDCLSDKLEVVPWSVPPKFFEKPAQKNRITILFVNSGNINTPEHFFGKGGAEVLESFKILAKKYNNIHLILRSGMPDELKNHFASCNYITIIDKPIPWVQLEFVWKTADIFVLPSHYNTSAQVFLDAMSYGLPIVTTDTWANSEFVQDNYTGYLIHNPRAARFTEGSLFHINPLYLREVMKGPCWDVVAGLVEKLSVLIENEKIRRAMGSNAKVEIETGKFNQESVKGKLKKVLDEATCS